MAKILHVGNPGGHHPFAHREPAVREVAAGLGFDVDNVLLDEYDDDVPCFTQLDAYRAVVLSTTIGRPTREQMDALIAFVQAGGALIGLHSAADSFKDNDRFMGLLGGRFRTHPAQLDVSVEITDPTHEITRGIEPFTLHEELYVLWYDPTYLHVLLHTTSHEGRWIPISWTRTEGKGRVFYLSLGHREEVYDNPQFRELLTRGMRWAIDA